MHKLKMLREDRHLLQKEVAETLGVDRTTYVKYENGNSEPSYEILVRIADYYNVSIDYLLNRKTSCYPFKAFRRLKKDREKRGEKIEEVAKRTDLPLSVYRDIENGNAEPTIQGLINLANYYCTTTDYILAHEGYFEYQRKAIQNNEGAYIKNTPEISELLIKFNELNGSGKKAVLEYIDWQLSKNKKDMSDAATV